LLLSKFITAGELDAKHVPLFSAPLYLKEVKFCPGEGVRRGFISTANVPLPVS
jgi:hypothetical protein